MAKPPSQTAANYKEPDFTAYVEKAKTPTTTQEHFTDWVIEKTGHTFASKKEEAAFRYAFALSTSLRGIHQASPENQERLAAQREAAKAAAEQAASAPKADKPAKAAPAKAAKATAPAPEPEPQTVEAAPAKATRPAAKRGGRRASTTTQAPF